MQQAENDYCATRISNGIIPSQQHNENDYSVTQRSRRPCIRQQDHAAVLPLTQTYFYRIAST